VGADLVVDDLDAITDSALAALAARIGA
jgi:hypothetical protein